jgi:AAA domain, putative AbiEii toxin, Type IV TA system
VRRVRLTDLRIENFRAISLFELHDLKDLVVVAGPNGCGKSCVFDAIRLLKSAYGGYQFNEWMQWFGEFQINPNDLLTFRALFRDPVRPVTMLAHLQLAGDEISFLQANAEAVFEPLVWAELTNQAPDAFGFSSLGYSGQFPHLIGAVAALTAQRAAELRSELGHAAHTLSLTVPPGGGISIVPSTVARVVFQTFKPQQLGIIDFHSASRTYAREGLGGVNLDSQAIEGQRRTQSLYNWQGKYTNIKSELVTTYVRDIIARQSRVAGSESRDLNDTLKELFQTFFPDKSYLGVQTDDAGHISFPVELATGERHDLNDLSSGEKEVLYGYLRLRNATPKHSTILIDEPELHLNPGLLRGFPDFYYRHVAQAHGNQVWLVTHSDTLLRQAVGNINYSVFHMTQASNVEQGGNQALPVAEDELQRALLDLVGDVAAFRPYAKVLIFEGDSNKQFDVSMVSRLFPRLAERANLVSGESKGRVQDLYAVLSRTAHQVGLADRFFAITDHDFDVPPEAQQSTHVLTWGVYHIENFLLTPKYMLAAMARVAPESLLRDEDSIVAALKAVAEAHVDGLVLQRLRKRVNDRIVRSVVIAGDPAAEPVTGLLPSIVASLRRVDEAEAEVANELWLHARADEYRDGLRQILDDGTWLEHFPGRPILSGFVQQHLAGKVSYDGFVNLVLDSMVEADYRPQGMCDVLAQVIPNP